MTFSLARPIHPHEVANIAAELDAVPGVERTEVSTATGLVTVTVDQPTDRGDIVEALERVGCRVRR